MTEEERLTEEQKRLVKATIKEFMQQIYAGVGKSVLEKIFWLAVGAVIAWYFGGHIPR